MLESPIKDFPGGPVDKTLPSNAGVPVWSLAGELKIPHTLQPKNQKIKEKQYCNKFSKDLRKEKKKKEPL